MNKRILMMMLAMVFSGLTYGQKVEVKAIKEAISIFAKAGDVHDVASLDKCLDSNYRIVMNQLFGSTEVSVVPKSIYLDKIKSKEWGGDQRKLTFSSVMVNGNTASAKVVMRGTSLSMSSIINLVKDANGNWKLVSDTPIII